MNMSVALKWTDVGDALDVPPQGARRVETDIGPIAVFRTVTEDYFAVFDKCPHKGGPLSEGIVHGKAVACPLHNWSISLETGEAMGVDAGKGCTPTVPLKIEQGRILLGLFAG
jgi:nitrite reductase (NADH) small subunit